MISTLEQIQVPKGTGPGVRRSKRPLLASRTRCNVLWKAPQFGNNPYGKNRGAAHFAARGLHVGNGVGCPWAAHGNFAMQIRLPTTSIYGNSGQLSGQLSRLPTTSIYGNSGQLSGQRSGLPMGCPWEFCHAN